MEFFMYTNIFNDRVCTVRMVMIDFHFLQWLHISRVKLLNSFYFRFLSVGLSFLCLFLSQLVFGNLSQYQLGN